MKGDQNSIETNEKRNAVIEKDVLRFQQREAVLKKVVIYFTYALVVCHTQQVIKISHVKHLLLLQ